MDREELQEKLKLLILLGRIIRKKHSKKRKKKFWFRRIFQSREDLGEYHRLFHGLRLGDRECFFR